MRPWACLLLLLAAAGCTPDYPMDREGTWHLGETGANDANLRTMIVNPHDLVAGTGETTAVGAEAAPPVRRLLTGQRYQLPSSDVLQINVVGSPQQQQPAAVEATMLDNRGALALQDPVAAGNVVPKPGESIASQRRIVAFVDDDASGAALQAGLAGIAQELDVRRGTVHQAARFLEKDTNIHALVVDIGSLSDPVAALQDLSRMCPPDVLVIAIGDSTDIGLYRTLVQGMGVTEYLPKPLTRDAVQTLLRPRLVGDQADPTAERGGHLVAVCGAQGGAGATSLAVNLAIQLAETAKATVALLDLHLQDGEAAVMLGVRPGPGLRIALEDPLRADALFLERSAIEVNPRVRLIAADETLDQELEITEAGVRHVLALLRRKFNFIVVDLPVPLDPAMRPVLAIARHVLVLLEAEVTGLRNAAGLRALVGKYAGSNRVFTVLNRFNRPGGLPMNAIVKGLGAPPDIRIPDLGRRMTEAVNSGIPAVRRVPALRRHLAPLVREIAGIRTGRSRFWLGRLFGR